MKKILTLTIGLMAALFSRAQGFVFQYQGQSLADGATVVIAAEEDMFGELSCETNNQNHPNDGLVLRTLGSTATSGTATLQITSNTLNPSGLQWCMGGACTPFGAQTSLTKQFSTGGGITFVQFDAVAVGAEGVLTATLRATIGLESHSVNIHFVNGDYDGIRSLPAANGKEASCFDLQGRPAQRQQVRGLYIVNDGGRIRKQIIR